MTYWSAVNCSATELLVLAEIALEAIYMKVLIEKELYTKADFKSGFQVIVESNGIILNSLEWKIE